MATAPYQFWIDLAPISTAVRVSTTVTITTVSAHGLQTGAYVQVAGATGASGTSMNGVYQVTVTTTTAFTYTAAGTAGTGVTTAAVVSYDLLNPLENYASGTPRQYTWSADVSSLNLTSSGDGSGTTMDATVLQENTPPAGPWFSLLPDQTRVRFAFTNTGSTPAATDVLFLGYLNSLTSRLNGSGQGTTTTLSLNNVNAVLDRVAVFGNAGGVATVTGSGGVRHTNVVTLTTRKAHGFGSGQVVTVEGVPGGGATSFNGTFTIASVPSITTLTYAQTAANYSPSYNGSIRYSVARDGISRTSVILNASAGDSAYINTGTPIILFKGNCRGTGFNNNSQVENLLFSDTPNTGKVHSSKNVTRISDTSFRLVLPGSIQGVARSTGSFTGQCGVFSSAGRVWDGSNVSGQTSVIIKGDTTETAAVNQLLSITDEWHSDDYALQRLLNTSVTSGIVGGTAYKPSEAIYITTTTLRSALDTILENYQADTRLRRYYISPQGELNYKLIDAGAVPTWADAPYKIQVVGAGSPNVSTSAATTTPYNLSVTLDVDTVKRAQFNVPKVGDVTSELNTVFAYTDLTQDTGGTVSADALTQLYTTRAGAPTFESVVDLPNATSALIPVAAAAWFKERHQPMLSGQFQLRGGGGAAWNSLGFFKGYYQSGASTFALTSWAVGQFVEVTAASLNLAGLYRVEEVSLSFEPASYNQIIDITFNRKNPADLAQLIANSGKASR